MKYLFVMLFLFSCNKATTYQELDTIILLKPDKSRGLPFMKTLDVRESTHTWSSKELNLQDLSDLLWSANGISRPSSGKRTASSAHNSQDIDIYAFMKERIYLYDAPTHILNSVAVGDYRSIFEKTDAPLILVLISDISRFRSDYEDYFISWANIDCGIVSQNISLFCAATGLKTRPRAIYRDIEDQIRIILELKDSQLVLLHHPVGYSKYPISIPRL